MRSCPVSCQFGAGIRVKADHARVRCSALPQGMGPCSAEQTLASAEIVNLAWIAPGRLGMNRRGSRDASIGRMAGCRHENEE
jgi:hypothetical protein